LTDASWPEILLIGLPLTFAAASLSFYVIEQPALRLKSRLQLKTRQGPQAVSTLTASESKRDTGVHQEV
jgi:peptidoglycan/LPS O-acetylase OafA/YrhL